MKHHQVEPAPLNSAALSHRSRLGRLSRSAQKIATAVDAYLEHCRARGLRSVTTITYRLKGVLRYHKRDRLLSQLTPRLAAELFAARCKEIAGDT